MSYQTVLSRIPDGFSLKLQPGQQISILNEQSQIYLCCPNKHEVLRRLKNIRNQQPCISCTKCNRSENTTVCQDRMKKKITILTGHTVLSIKDRYVTYICKFCDQQAHSHESNLLRETDYDKRCDSCAQDPNKNTFDDIIKIFNEQVSHYELLTTRDEFNQIYKNKDSSLRVKCKKCNNENYYVKTSSAKRNKGCDKDGCASSVRSYFVMNKYGVQNVMQLDKVKIEQKLKFIENLEQRYEQQILGKKGKTCHIKKFIFPSGKVSFVEGYEHFVLSDLIDTGFIENDIKINIDVPVFKYSTTTSSHLYFPDIFIESIKTIIEVKSTFTYNKDPVINHIKGLVIAKNGYKFEIWIINENGTVNAKLIYTSEASNVNHRCDFYSDFIFGEFFNFRRQTVPFSMSHSTSSQTSHETIDDKTFEIINIGDSDSDGQSSDFDFDGKEKEIDFDEKEIDLDNNENPCADSDNIYENPDLCTDSDNIYEDTKSIEINDIIPSHIVFMQISQLKDIIRKVKKLYPSCILFLNLKKNEMIEKLFVAREHIMETYHVQDSPKMFSDHQLRSKTLKDLYEIVNNLNKKYTINIIKGKLKEDTINSLLKL